MKSRAYTFFCVLIASAFLQSALAAEAAPVASSTTEANVKSLQQELSEAKDRVAELEAELSKAQSTIEQMNKNTTVAAQDTDQPAKAKDQTVRGEPLYDAYNPQTPVAQQNVIAEKFTPETQSQAVATTRLLEDDLERSRIRNITRIADQVPNMQYGQSGNEARISIRGMRTNRTGAEADPVVAIFEDGVSVPTTTQALEPYVDVNRIEVLRGPQGVMYGRNAFGGVINIISNEPDPSGWDAAFEGEYGYADGTRFDAMLNVPILETLSNPYCCQIRYAFGLCR